MAGACIFTVLGLPAPQGSKTIVRARHGFGNHVIEGSSDTGRAKTRAWRESVADAALVQRGMHGQFDGPVALDLVLRFPRPRSRPKTHHGWHVVKPDKDKVLRACLDALVHGGLLRDDALVCRVRLEAREVTDWTGASFTLAALAEVTK